MSATERGCWLSLHTASPGTDGAHELVKGRAIGGLEPLRVGVYERQPYSSPEGKASFEISRPVVITHVAIRSDRIGGDVIREIPIQPVNFSGPGTFEITVDEGGNE